VLQGNTPWMGRIIPQQNLPKRICRRAWAAFFFAPGEHWDVEKKHHKSNELSQ